MSNPFSVTSPENLKPQELADLFVDVLSDLPNIVSPTHTFIHGSRGTGKSMMLRYLEPEVQRSAQIIKEYNELNFVAIHVPLKNATFISELGRLCDNRFHTFSEHLLVSHICLKLFETLSTLNLDDTNFKECDKTFAPFISRHLSYCGYNIDKTIDVGSNCFSFCKIKFEEIFTIAFQYLKRLAFPNEPVPYEGPLCGYLDFLVPVSKCLQKLSFLPNCPFFIMLDDADNMPLEMQKVINNWVSCRTNDSICLKITTQLRYKTYRTTFGSLIETPHDYSEVDLTTVYSPKTSNFEERIKLIVEKRFSVYGIRSTANDFFPENAKQREGIELIKKELKQAWKAGHGKGFRPSDDVTRYAVPEYIRRLGGTKKATSKFSYAGFSSMVTLATGIIRWFLEPAFRMYSKCSSISENSTVRFIPPSIQDEIIRDWSREFLTDDFNKLRDSLVKEEKDLTIRKDHAIRATKLLNIINGLGMLFQTRLMDETLAERRVFSIMISDQIDDDLQSVLNLGVDWGYLQMSMIGTKEGIGRNPLYILSRRLAPVFKLDVTGFVGNLSVTSSDLKLSYYNPKRFAQLRSKDTPTSLEQLPLLNEIRSSDV